MKLTDLVKLGGMKPRKVYRQETPGTYNLTFPADVNFVIATLQAGGGGGYLEYGGLTSKAGARAGGCIYQRLIPIQALTALPAVIGAGGAGVYAYTANAQGRAGGNSSFAGLVAPGGRGGIYDHLANDAAGVPDSAFPPVYGGFFPYGPAHSKYTTLYSPTIPAAIGDIPLVPFNPGTNLNGLGGGASLWANGGNGGTSSPDNSTGGSLGSGAGSCLNNLLGFTSKSGGNGFLEIIYFSDGTVAVS